MLQNSSTNIRELSVKFQDFMAGKRQAWTRAVAKRLFAILCIGLAAMVGGLMAQAQTARTYDFQGLPSSIDWDVAGGTRYEGTFTVSDDFSVDDVQFDITWFTPYVALVDIFIEAPDGTQVTLFDYACRGAPVSFGRRNYDIANPIADPGGQEGQQPPQAQDGTPASYTFVDNGRELGADYVNQVGPPGDTVCHEYWADSINRPDPTWPTQAIVHADLWPHLGAFRQLPTELLYGLQDGAFGDFAGMSAQGTWKVIVRKWGFAGGPSETSPWLQADTVIQSASLTFRPVQDSNPPAFSKSLSAAQGEQGELVTMTYKIDNSAGTDAIVRDLAFTETLPTGTLIDGTVLHDGTTLISNSCFGTLSAANGATTISLSDGVVMPGESCEIVVTLAPSQVGTITLQSGDLTSSAGNSGSSSAQYTVTQSLPLAVTKDFSVAQVLIGQTPTPTLDYVFSNPRSIKAKLVNFSETLPTGLQVASGTVLSTCPASDLPYVKSVIDAVPGASSFSVSNTGIPPHSGIVAGTCKIQIPVTASTPGTYQSAATTVSSTFGTVTSTAASIEFTEQLTPSFTKTFDPDLILIGETTTLTYEITANGTQASNLSFDETLPAGLVLTDTGPQTSGCDLPTLTADSGTRVIQARIGSVDFAQTCSITLEVRANQKGQYQAESSDLLSTSLVNPSDGSDTPISATVNSGTASASLTVHDNTVPLFSKVFDPAQIEQGDTTILTYTLDLEAGLAPVTDVEFTDQLPEGLVIDALSATDTDCDGTKTLGSDGRTFEFSGGSLDAGSVCTLAVIVRSVTPGAHTTDAVSLTSDLGDTEAAAISLQVTAADSPLFSSVFDPDEIEQGESTVLTYTIENATALVAATALSFTDQLPEGLVIDALSTTEADCAGTKALGDDGRTFEFSDGTLESGSACTLAVIVSSDTAGTFTTDSVLLTSNLGDRQAAATSLKVTSADAPIFTSLFDPDEMDEGESTVLTYTIDNAAALVSATALDFTDPLPDGLLIDDTIDVESDCDGTVTVSTEDNSITLASGSVAAQEACSIAVGITSSTPGEYRFTSADLSSSLGTSAGPTATLTVLDVTPPTVVITAAADAFTDLSAIEVIFTFSEDVSGFERSDIVVGSGTASDFSAVSATVYTASVTPSGNGDLTIDVPAGAANDTSSNANGNLAAEQLVIKNGIIELTQRIIRNFIAGRMDTIVSNEPELGDRLTQRATTAGGTDSGYAVNYQAGSANISFDTSLAAVRASLTDQRKLPYQSSIMRKTGLYGQPEDGAPQAARFDIWTKGTWSHSKTDTRRADTGLLYVGADWLLNEDLVVGVLTQFDWTLEDDKDSVVEVEGFGWMAGPYAVQRLAEHLTLEGRFALGQSDNKVNPIGLYSDSFDTDRVLVSSQLTGTYDWHRYTVHPFFRAIYMEERQNDYTDSLGNHIGEQVLSLGRVNFGPKIATTFTGSDGTTFSPYATLAGLYDFEGGRVTDLEGFVINEGRLRGRFTGGLNLLGSSGWNLGSAMFYDGIGQDKIEAMGFNLSLNLSF